MANGDFDELYKQLEFDFRWPLAKDWQGVEIQRQTRARLPGSDTRSAQQGPAADRAEPRGEQREEDGAGKGLERIEQC